MSAKHSAPRRVLYAQYTNPAAYPPLAHSSRILADAGWQVLFLGTVAAGDTMRFSNHPRITTRYLQFEPPGVGQKFHFVFFCIWVLYWALCFRPQFFYASDLLATPSAFLANMLLRCRMIYHEHDMPSPPHTVWAQWQFAARRAVARRAKVCIQPNAERARIFENALSIENVVCVWNCPAQSELLALDKSRARDELRLYYHGSLVPARLPLSVIEALAQLPPQIVLRAVGYETTGHCGYRAELHARADALGVRERVEIMDAVPRAELFELCRENDVGLALLPLSSDDVNERYMLGASNKPFDYLACGLALLISDLPEWRALYGDYARDCDPADATSIANAVRWFWEQRAECRAMGERGYARVRAEWTYEMQFAPVLEFMEKCCGV